MCATRSFISGLLAIALLSWGCKGVESSASPPTAAESAAVQGLWKADLPDTPKASSNNAGQNLSQAFAGLFGTKVRFIGGDRYRLTLMGKQIDGHFKVKGSELVLIPEKVGGKTKDQQKPEDQSNPLTAGTDDPMETLTADLSSDKKTMTLHTTNAITGDKRKVILSKEDQSQVANTLHNDVERVVVGIWDGDIQGEAGSDPYKKSFLGNPELELRQDNTFRFYMLLETKGTWFVDAGKVTLIPGGSASDQPETLAISPDDKTLTMTQGNDTIVFKKLE